MRRPDSITGEVALVTGASRGLGLALARELARHSCPLVICARDSAELERAAQDLRNRGVDVVTVAGDITAAGMPQQLVDTAVERFGRLDILVNNAGIIQVGPVSSLTASDYETAVRAMALAPMQLALAALPVMRAQAHGRIVTITSIGGKVSVPHLMPYAMAKFAAVGFSEGLRAELGSHPVSVTTIVPGLMRTGSHLNALFAGRKNAEFTWFGLAASLPFLSMDAGRAAQQIVAAAAARRAELILTPAGQLVARTGAIAPGVTAAILHAAHRLVLPGTAGEGSGTARGHRLRPIISPAVFDRLTVLGRRAAGRLNENPAPAGSGLPPGPS
jgi:short-subunit dehydrogenase